MGAVITGFHIVYYLRCPLYQGTNRQRCCLVCFHKWPVPTPVQRGGLWVWEEGETLPLCALKPQPLLCGSRYTLQTRLQSQMWCTQKGTRGRVAASVRCRPLCRPPVPKFSFRLAAGTHLNFWVHFFFSYSKKVTSKILIRTDNFILPFIFSHFPHLTKKKSRSPSPVPSASPFMQTENGNALLL